MYIYLCVGLHAAFLNESEAKTKYLCEKKNKNKDLVSILNIF